MSQPDPRTMLSTAEAAARLGVHKNTIGKWIASGQLRAYRFGPRELRLDPADVDAQLTEYVPPQKGSPDPR